MTGSNKVLSNFKLPTIKEEDWKNTDLSELNKYQWNLITDNNLKNIEDFKHLIDDDDISIVLINGVFNEEYSKLDDSIVVSILKKTKNKSDNFLVSLNNDNFSDGVKIDIAENVKIEPTIHILNILSGNEHSLVLPRQEIAVGQSSQAHILQTTVSADEYFYFVDSVTDISLDKNAHLSYVSRQMTNRQSYLVTFTNIKQERDSSLSALALDLGSKLTRNNLNITLEEEGAEANLNGLYAIYENQHIDNQSSVRHQAPNCLSNQLYKGVLEDSARSVFKGKILVDKIAQGTNAYQLNKNLVLGEKAQVYTKPQLEIFADDVKCTHGATIGQLNPEEVFYLNTRGLDNKEATKMLTKGFVEDVLDILVDKTLKNRLKLFLEGNIKILQ